MRGLPKTRLRRARLAPPRPPNALADERPMTTDPFDTDAGFELPAAPAAPSSAPAGGGIGMPLAGTDARREQRVRVSWPARVKLPTGTVIEMRVRDLSEGGIGFTSPKPLPTNTPMNFALGAPALDDPKTIAPIVGTLKAVYVVLQPGGYQIGAVWQQIGDAERDVIGRWVRRHKR